MNWQIYQKQDLREVNWGKSLRNMDKMISATNQKEPKNAEKFGILAKQFLQRGLDLLEEVKDKINNSQLRQANDMLDQIKKEQQELLNETKANLKSNQDSNNGSEAAKSQKEVGNKFKGLMQKLGKIANVRTI